MTRRRVFPPPVELWPLFAATVIVGTIAIVAYHAWRVADRHSSEVAVTQQVVQNINGLLLSLHDADSKGAGWYERATADIRAHLQNLAALASTRTADQAARLARLQELCQAKIEQLGKAVAGEPDTGLREQVLDLSDEIVKANDERLAREEAAVRDSANMLGLVSTAGSAALFAILIFAIVRTATATRARREVIGTLRQNQELLTSFVRNVPAAVAMLDRNLRYVQASDRWFTDFQLNRKEVLGRSHYEVFPEIPECWKQVHNRCLAGETMRAEEDCFERFDGRRTWLRWEVRPWGEREGSPEGILIFSEDITQRRELQEMLRGQRERINKILSTIPGAVFVFRRSPDGATSVPYVSPAFHKMLPELPDLTADAGPLFAMMHEEDVGRLRASVRESARGVTAWRERFRISSPSKGTLWFEGYSVPEREPDGSICWTGFLTDITDRMRMDSALRETEAITQALFDAAAQGIVGVNAKGQIEMANQMATTMFGYDENELIGLPLEDLLPENVREEHIAHRAAFMGRPRNRPMGVGLDLLARRKNATTFPVEVSLTHLKTSRGALTVGFLTDISVRKEAEHLLIKSEAELRRLAGTLLTAQEDERRRIARDLHDDVMQEVGLLTGCIDQWLLDLPPAEAETQNRLQSLLSQTERILQKIRSVSHQLHPSIIEELGLSTALRVLCDEFAVAHGIEITFEAVPRCGKPSVENSSCLYRVCQECLQNATRHGHATEIQVTLGKAGQNMGLSVRDNGTGFSVEQSGEPGLGIVSMKERVRAVRGALSISSAPGAGTEVHAYVPFGKTPERISTKKP